MLKGINKQIIEIKCPESEHFEKILLFIKSENGYVPVKHLGSEIYEYYASLVGKDSPGRKKHRRFRPNTLKILIAAGIIVSGMTGLLALLLIL